MMDFVFSESEEGGIYDNRNGVDYHIPVSGSIAKETPMHIVHIAVEMAPVAKVIHISKLNFCDKQQVRCCHLFLVFLCIT